jgi:predicted PurR-regulated permease PerM
MTLVLLCVFVIPLWLAIGTIVSNTDQFVAWTRSLSTLEVPPCQDWLAGLPLIGKELLAAWKKVAVAELQDFLKKLAPYGGVAARWFASEVGSFGSLVLQFF